MALWRFSAGAVRSSAQCRAATVVGNQPFQSLKPPQYLADGVVGAWRLTLAIHHLRKRLGDEIGVLDQDVELALNGK